MKSILISIKPQWCEKICHKIGKDENGKPIYEKCIEVRKSAPSEVPFKAYLYATRPKKFYTCGAVSTSDELLWLANGKVEMGDGFKFWADGDEYQCLNGRIIGEFVCDKVERFSVGSLRSDDIEKLACLSYNEMISYFYKPEELDGETVKQGFAWHISDLKIYDKPKELSEFRKSGFMTEEEWLFNLYPNTHCHYEAWAKKFEIARPPQSWCYVEELK